jgi:hypothetical protein
LPSHAQLDEAAAKVGVNETAFGSCDRLKQIGVCDAFLTGKPREPPGLEYLRASA